MPTEENEEIEYFGLARAECCGKEAKYIYTLSETYRKSNCEPIDMVECVVCKRKFKAVQDLHPWELPSYY